MEDPIAKEKYRKERRQFANANRRKSSAAARGGGPGVATQIRLFADNYKSSFLGAKIAAGSERDTRNLHQVVDPSSGVDGRKSRGVDSRVMPRDRNTSSFKRAQRVVKRKLFCDEETKFGMDRGVKDKLRLSNKQLRLEGLSSHGLLLTYIYLGIRRTKPRLIPILALVLLYKAPHPILMFLTGVLQFPLKAL